MQADTAVYFILCVGINHLTCTPCSFHQFRLYCIAGTFCRRRFNDLFKDSLVVLFRGSKFAIEFGQIAAIYVRSPYVVWAVGGMQCWWSMTDMHRPIIWFLWKQSWARAYKQASVEYEYHYWRHDYEPDDLWPRKFMKKVREDLGEQERLRKYI